MEWIDALNAVLRDTEASLESEAGVETIAGRSGYSPFYLQRIFTMLTGMTLGEYLRGRRLSEAGAALQKGATVLETALRFGWDSPESFNRAFKKFHGATPSAAQKGCALKYITPLHLTIQLTVGTLMNFTSKHRPEQTVIGVERRFSYENSFAEIPKFWDECRQNNLCAPLGVCFDDNADGRDFAYMIGRFCEPDAPVPEGMTKRALPACDWACFECTGPMPDAIQQLNRRIFTEWLPGNGRYTMAEPVNIEWYDDGDSSAPDYKSGIMIPVK